MLSHFNLPQVPGRDVQIFTVPSVIQPVVDYRWNTWVKPRGLSMAYIFVLGGGGGGGKGLAGVAGNARGGAGGGGSSGQTSMILPLHLLPDQLYIMVGNGGTGARDPGVVATNGSNSIVSVHPEFSITNYIAQAIYGAFGQDGSGAGNAAAGIGGPAALLTNMPLSAYGHMTLLAGQTGSTGGSPTSAGTAIALPVTGLRCMGGTGGGGSTTSDFAGGAITGITNSHLSQYAPVAAVAAARSNGSSTMLWKPFFTYSGMGGGSNNSVQSGEGGNALYGSGAGGGAGGLGTAAAENSPGGTGGHGIVIISCW